MKAHLVLLTIIMVALCGVAEAQSHTWNGAADTPEWYRFSAVPETEDPIVWVNNWSEVIYQYPGEDPPEQGSWDWPSGNSTATVPFAEPDLHSDSATVSSLDIGLGASVLLRNTLQCITLNTAGIVSMGRDGRVFECAIQDNGGTGILRSEKGYTFTVADPTLQNVIISVPVEIPNDMALGLWGNIQLNNIIKILSVSNIARLVIDSDVTLTGPGWVETSTSEDNEICRHYANGQRLTNQVTIHAAGKIGCDNIAVTNEGLIVADRTNMLTIQPDDEPNDGLPGVVNTGTLRAADGATMRLHNGVFDNAGGVIEAWDGSVVDLFDYAHISGGTLQTLGTGEIRPAGTGSSVSDVTVAAGSALVIPNSRKLRFKNTVTIDGELRLESTGSDTFVLVRSPVFLDGAGEVVLSDSEGNRFSFDGLEGGYRLTSAIPIRGATGEPGGLANGIALTNQSTITADGVNQLLLNPHDAPIDGLAGVINTGTLRAINSATMRLYDGSFDNAGGVIEAQNGSVVELHDNVRLTGGILQTTGSGVVRSTTGYLPPSLSDLTVEGRIEALGGPKLKLGGLLVNNGVIEAEDHVLPVGDLVLTGTGELRLVDGGQIRADGDSVTNDTGHTIRASGGAVNRIRHVLTHKGHLVVDSGASLEFHENCVVFGTSSTHVNGTLEPSGTLTMSGELAGAGTINGAVALAGTGVIAPGSSTGTLTIGNLTIADGATYQWQFSSSTGSDLVDVNGTLDMGGATLTVSIDLLEGDVPDRVVLFEYNTLASTPGVSQFVLTDGFTFTGVDTSNNELALTGVEDTGLIFADDFESGDFSRWSAVQADGLKSLGFDPVTNGLNLQLVLPGSLLARSGNSLLVDGRDSEGGLVMRVVSRAGALRAGVWSPDGWRWSRWYTPAGSDLEVVWRSGELELYDVRGLVAAVTGGTDRTLLSLVRTYSTREVEVQPAPAATR